MKFNYNDGGREAAGFKGFTGDCVCRAIAIATERPYKEIYDLINEYGKKERMGKHQRSRSNARTGVYIKTERKIMEDLGWEWVPTMLVGQGCKVHLRAEELPKGRLIVSVSRHETCVIDGVIHDTYDCSREGSRCVYGYYHKKPEVKKPKTIQIGLKEDELKKLVDLCKDQDRGLYLKLYRAMKNPIIEE